MGTRSITTIIDNQWGKPEKVCTMYAQFDGYPSGHGVALFDFLVKMKPCNGLGGKAPQGMEWANGAGCLAAQMIKHFKDGPGGFYMTKTRTTLAGEDYGYEITFNQNMTLTVVAKSYKGKIFGGSLHNFGIFCAKDK